MVSNHWYCSNQEVNFTCSCDPHRLAIVAYALSLMGTHPELTQRYMSKLITYGKQTGMSVQQVQ